MTSRSNSRKARGMRTQAAIAERWKASGLFPWATDAGAGRAGRDILNTPGIAPEIKARDTVSLQAALKQAEGNSGSDIALVIWRHNGQGEANMGQWTVTMSLEDFEYYEQCRQSRENRNDG